MEKITIEFDPDNEGRYSVTGSCPTSDAGLELIKVGADLIQEYVTNKKSDGTLADELIDTVIELGGKL